MSVAPASTVFGRVIVAIVGFIFAAGFGWALVYEMQHPPVHSGHVYLYAGLGSFGLVLIALMASADYVIVKVGGFVRILPLPWLGKDRRRASAEMKVTDTEEAPLPKDAP